MNKPMGFTLIEVMVALLVVAMALSALLTQMSGMIDHTAYLRDKALAQWVANNQLTLERLANRHNNELLVDVKSGSATMGGREWFWTITPQRTVAEGFMQLSVTVRAEQDGEPLATLEGLVDHFHWKRS